MYYRKNKRGGIAIPLFLVEVTGLRTEIRRVTSVTPNASNQENDQHSLCNKTSMSNLDIDVFAVSRYYHYRKNKRDGIAIPLFLVEVTGLEPAASSSQS